MPVAGDRAMMTLPARRPAGYHGGIGYLRYRLRNRLLVTAPPVRFLACLISVSEAGKLHVTVYATVYMRPV